MIVNRRGTSVGSEVLRASQIRHIRPPHERSHRHTKRLLSDDEIRLFWRACDQEGYPYGWLYQLLLLTGQRPGEIRELKRSELDLQSRELILPIQRTKSRRGHIVRISEFAAEIVEKVCDVQDTSFLLFLRGGRPATKSNLPLLRVQALMIQYQFETLTNAGRQPSDTIIERWHLRDLRCTAATLMFRLGHPMEVVGKILNHATDRSRTDRTLNSKHELLEERAALEDLGRFISNLVR
jgi:integrase